MLKAYLSQVLAEMFQISKSCACLMLKIQAEIVLTILVKLFSFFSTPYLKHIFNYASLPTHKFIYVY